jgi:dolichyl-phosphate beta-glucosyltransferase
MGPIQIVIPCYNEALRFQEIEASALLQRDDVSVILVNDGSTDATPELLEHFSGAHPNRVKVLHLKSNRGKAEAVRAGMELAIDQGALVTGFLDGDFATPASEMLRLVEIFTNSETTDVLLGSRWLHLGADIQRQTLRHYGGRVFATIASQVLNLKVYDTQCGAKLFRVGEALRVAMEQDFISSWAFDVELIGRLRQQLPESVFLEVPLNRWIDVEGSKIGLMDMLQATLSLISIRRALNANR